MPIYSTIEEINTRGGIFDAIVNSCFDAAVLLDTDLHIIHHSINGDEFLEGIPNRKAIGISIKELDSYADFGSVIKTGKDSKYTYTIIKGTQCIHHIIPIIENKKVIAVLAVVLFKSLSVLKKLLGEYYNDNEEANTLYNKLSRIEPNYTLNNFIGKSSVILNILEKTRKLAPSKHSILIFGETGTGKEILANGIHTIGRQESNAPLIKINCSAIPADLLESELFGHEKGAFTGAASRKIGKFELAENGSILLDEIGEMDIKVQAKLLRALEEKEFERVGGNKLIPLRARVIASSNKNLEEQSKKGCFRQDLYYRLCHFEIYIPPLREHREDIPLLLDHFIDIGGMKMRFAPEALNILINYEWPGNVRQLRNIVDALNVLNDKEIIDREDILNVLKLPHYLANVPVSHNRSESRLSVYVDYSERDYLIQALQETKMNVARAAKILNISRCTMYNKIKKYNIKLERQELQELQ
jgi:sigma-54 dependent transcriptional regulator, acetoin dehydrogenase operon transcriptional activator AcoR